MPIKDPEILQKIDLIKDHYHNNINNRFLRKALVNLKIPREVWNGLEQLTQESDYYKLQGYRYKELYEQIFAAATFVYHAKQEILPNLKSLVKMSPETIFSRQRGDLDRERILREMAYNNFGANIGVFCDMINELYVLTVQLDKREHPQNPIYERMSELKELGQLLI